MAVERFRRLILGTGLSGTDNADGTITIDATGGGGGVDSLAASGEAQLTGDVTLSAGTGIALNQSGNDIEIENTAGGAPVAGGGEVPAAFSIKDSAITSTATSYGAFSDAEVTRLFLPNFGAAYTADLRPEIMLLVQLTNSGGSNTTFMDCAIFGISNGDTAPTLYGTTGELSHVGSTGTYKMHSTWQAFGALTITKDHALLILRRKVSAGTGTFGVPACWIRWVEA